MPPEACSVNASLIAAYPQSAIPSFVYKTPIRVIRLTNIRPETEPTMTVLYLASDLIWATKIKSTAEAIGVEARPVRSIEMLTARLEDTEAAALILDLEAAETALAMLDFLKGPDAPDHAGTIRTLAFAPHVKRDIIDEARVRGAHEVLTRGSFDHDLPEILLRLAARNP